MSRKIGNAIFINNSYSEYLEVLRANTGLDVINLMSRSYTTLDKHLEVNPQLITFVRDGTDWFLEWKNQEQELREKPSSKFTVNLRAEEMLGFENVKYVLYAHHWRHV